MLLSQAGVLSVMCANNLVNGLYVCENNMTTNGILRAYVDPFARLIGSAPYPLLD